MNESLINRFIYNVIVFDDDDGNGWDVDADGRWEMRLFISLCKAALRRRRWRQRGCGGCRWYNCGIAKVVMVNVFEWN